MVHLSKATQADGKVTSLPTASPRRVNNYRFAEQRRAAIAARKASPFAGRYLHHHEREANQLASDLAPIVQTPVLLIVSALLRTMDDHAVSKVLEQLAPGAVAGRTAHRQAVTAVKVSRLNVGQLLDLLRAQGRLNGEGR
jgi:hypothetical protein